MPTEQSDAEPVQMTRDQVNTVRVWWFRPMLRLTVAMALLGLPLAIGLIVSGEFVLGMAVAFTVLMLIGVAAFAWISEPLAGWRTIYKGCRR